jgi:hypothetical protein
MRTGDAGENSQGSGETGGLTDGFLLVRLGEESAGSTQCVHGSVDGLWCVVLLHAACCMVHEAYAGRVDCLRCVELLPLQVGAAAMTNSRREQSC